MDIAVNEELVSQIAEEVRPSLKTDRLRLDQAATEDVVRIVLATQQASKP